MEELVDCWKREKEKEKDNGDEKITLETCLLLLCLISDSQRRTLSER